MTKNQILTSSDHHANWGCLEELFKIANKKKIPFVINGDIIGDYNFEIIKNNLKLKFPYEIENEILKKELSEELFEKYITYYQIKKNNGNVDFLLNGIPQHLQQKLIEKLNFSIKIIEGSDFQNKLKNILEDNKIECVISENKIKIKSLYDIILKTHAKKLANLIDKYQVKTYFLLGNHEPINFVELTKKKLKNFELLEDLGKIKGIKNVNGVSICGVSNVCAIMPFIHEIYSQKEIEIMFSHQTGKKRPILFKNVTKQYLETSENHKLDEDWFRIMNNQKENFDVFFTHGQVGIGAWRDDKQCNEMPTLHVAAMLSELSKLTIDGHLHTTHQMKNSLEKDTIRAVGNKAFLLTKLENGEIEKELFEVDKNYDTRGKIDLNGLDLKTEILKEINNK